MPRITDENRHRIINLRTEGHGYGTICQMLKANFQVDVTKRSVKKLIKKYNDTGTVMNKQRTGQAKLHTEEHIEFVNKCLRETPDLSAKSVNEKLMDEFAIEVSTSSVARFRKKLGWSQHNTRYCQLIRDANKEKRKDWCELMIANNEEFNDVIFTDESKIELQRMSRRSFRKKGDPVPRQPKPKHPLSVLVWAGISKKGPTPLVIFSGIMDSEFYQQSILKDAFLPFVETHFPESHRLFQDNDPKHTSKSTKQYMEENGINWWKSPAESPDINPIENLWAELKHYIASRVKPRNKQELEDGLHRFWLTVTAEKCQAYISHIHKVIPEVIVCNGGATGY